MSLDLALKAHAKSDLKEAEKYYKLAYLENEKDPRLFQNYGSLLNRGGNFDLAKEVYEKGLSYNHKNLGIIGNYANLLRSRNKTLALHYYFKGLHYSFIKLSKAVEACSEFYLNIIEILINEGHYNWALSLTIDSIVRIGVTPKFLKCLILLFDSDHSFHISKSFQELLHSRILSIVDNCNDVDAASLYFALASHFRCTLEYDKASFYFDLAFKRASLSKSYDIKEQQDIQSLIDMNSWNFGCGCLQGQKLSKGWTFFEYGLRTPADGIQKWQRALIKPFSADDVRLWRGESGLNQRLLLLEEQAIGDGMMFATLLPTLLNEFSCLGLVLSKRLLPIYNRSFRDFIQSNKLVLYGHDDIKSGKLSAADFDYQSPIGSVCQYRFTSITSYAPKVPILHAKDKLKTTLRSEYVVHGSSKELIIGISWSGGAKGNRMKEKSIDVAEFGSFLLGFKNVRFINLQYGQSMHQIKVWRDQGIDVIHDARINPLQDMDSWLSQVSACDGVISVANTTIHGCGGLNIPTMCLLSIYSDWRWFTDPEVLRSYWYPSVGIARQHKTLGWSPALQQISTWISSGCPLPSGPISTVCA